MPAKTAANGRAAAFVVLLRLWRYDHIYEFAGNLSRQLCFALTAANDRIAVGVLISLGMIGSGIARLMRVVESHGDSRCHHNDC